MIRRLLNLCICVLPTTLLLFSAANNAAAKYDDFAFDPAVFTERLREDWAAHDGIDRAVIFTDAQSCGKARDAVDRLLTALEADEAAETYGEELTYDYACGIGAPEYDRGRVDASPVGVAALRARFDALAAANAPGADPRWETLYDDACRVRRARRLADAAELTADFVYTKHFVIGASHYAYTEDVTDEWHIDYSFDRRSGAQLLRGSFAPDGSIRNEVLVAAPSGMIRDPDVSWDGKRVLFSMRSDLKTDDFHLYEYDMETKETRQITSGPGVADIEPVYLPNGDLLFCSTRCTQITDCSWTEVSNLYTCGPKGEFLRRVSVDQVSVNYPKLLSDGRVIYTRWDYNDRGQIFPQPLFQMNPDGTAQTEFYGNNSFFPTTIMHARGIPGSDRVVAVAGGHHTHQHGKLILIDRTKGTQENTGCTLAAPIRETPAARDDLYGQRGELFQYPYPLDDTTLLCAYLPNAYVEPDKARPEAYPVPFGLYWFNLDGARELLAFDPAISCGQPVSLAEREVPTTRPSQVDLTQTTGKFYVQDVYEGPGLAGIERGTVKALRVVALEFRCAGIRDNSNNGPAGGAMICTPPAVDNGTWDVKHVLGEVPVEEDGSAYFEVPALTPVYFQLLDARGDVVQTMRSWSTLQPGETFGCVGCHEAKGSVIGNAETKDGSTTLALKRDASVPRPVLFPGKGVYSDAGLSFVRDIQPILDHHCVRCHDGREGRPFSLLGNEDVSPAGLHQTKRASRSFSESYLKLTQYGEHNGRWINWLGIQEGPGMLPPYAAGASKSPLIAMFRGADGSYGGQDANHKEVKIDEASVRLLAMWIDLLVPYCGDYREANKWDVVERAHYEYAWAKRQIEERLNAFNVELKRAADTTGADTAADTRSIGFGGMNDRMAFISGYTSRRLPSVARRSGDLNVYRNLALNPRDVQGDEYEVAVYPHASSNSEYAYLDEFAAKNVIDGRKETAGHGPDFPSWGPNLRTDLWLKVDFGCEVEVDKCVVYLRADFPHDGVWESGTLEFSDGSRVPVVFRATGEPQVFNFPKRRVTSVRLADLKPAAGPLKWSGVTEIEFWGRTAE